MFNGKCLQTLLADRHISNRSFLSAMGWASSRQMYQFINGNPTAATLEKIADYLQVPIDSFFLRTMDTGNEGNRADSEKAYLEAVVNGQKSLLDEKDKRIATLEKLLEILENRDNTGTKNNE